MVRRILSRLPWYDPEADAAAGRHTDRVVARADAVSSSVEAAVNARDARLRAQYERAEDRMRGMR